MRKVVKLLLTITMVIVFMMPVTLVTKADDAQQIMVTINGQYIKFDQPPIIINGRTLVPLRAIFENLGATVDWDDKTQTVTAKRGTTTVSLTVGDNNLFVNGNEISLDVPAQIISDRTLVPIRAVSAALGGNVNWNPNSQTVEIENDFSLPCEVRIYDAVNGDQHYKIIYGEKGEIYIEKGFKDYWTKGIYDKKDDTMKFEDSDGHKSTHYYYENDGHLNNFRLQYTYYENEITYREFPNGYWYKVTYDKNNNSIYCEHSSGLREEYICDHNNNIISAESSKGWRVEVIYNSVKAYPAVLRYITEEFELWERFSLLGIRG